MNTVILGDCLEVLGGIPDNSVDSIITDPPYGLSKEPNMMEVLSHWLNGDDYEHRGGGFMGRDWDGFVPGPAIWRECYRVLKPGGCLMAFGGTRTCDLLSIAIRLAGFQRFDELVWLHGQGFGKGIAIDKGIDSLLGKAGEREVIGKQKITGQALGKKKGLGRLRLDQKFKTEWDITAPATEAAALFSGWRSQLKPSHEVILCFWKPREKSFAHNALKWGVSGLWIDGCRIGLNGEKQPTGSGDRRNGNVYAQDEYTRTKTSNGGNVTPSTGRYPANVLLSHDPRCVRVGVKRVRGITGGKNPHKAPSPITMNGGFKETANRPYFDYADPDGLETVPDYRCHPDCAVGQLDRQAGVSKSPATYRRNAKGGNEFVWGKGIGEKAGDISVNYGDSGSASRFYYTPKAPPREKWFFCEICDDVYPYKERDDHAHGKPKGQRKHQIAHPTVKPLSIANYTLSVLEYLCRLTKTPTGGIVLDPFAGSGTTALAAIANGRPFILIENDPIYHRIAEKRIEQAMKEPRQLTLFSGTDHA